MSGRTTIRYFLQSLCKRCKLGGLGDSHRQRLTFCDRSEGLGRCAGSTDKEVFVTLVRLPKHRNHDGFRVEAVGHLPEDPQRLDAGDNQRSPRLCGMRRFHHIDVDDR